MKERPILFSAPMVRAILEGRKTQTRRIIKLTDSGRVKAVGAARNWHIDDQNAILACPQGRPGDHLWVKETHARIHEDLLQHLDPDPNSPHWQTAYRADGDPANWKHYGMHWKPSIFMRREFSRITLEVASVGVERLQNISEDDAKAEGAPLELGTLERLILGAKAKYRSGYVRLWQSINGPDSWDANPWVWVITFKKVIP